MYVQTLGRFSDMTSLFSRRRHQRYEICLPATIELKDQSLSCVSRNLSVGGVSLILPFNTGLYDINSAHGLEISEISYFSAELVWTSDNLCGLKFLGSKAAVRKMSDYLEAYVKKTAEKLV